MIITTNFDLLLEKTQYDLKDSSTPIFELLPIRSINESHTIPSKKQVPYYKLNGCMSDRSKYKFIFSSNDFRTANKYYKKVLNSLNSLSNDISFLSIGYSYSDPLAQIILDKFDSYNYRERKWIYSVDPSMEETDVRLDYFTQNKISIIKMTGLDFFDAYNKWESQKIKNKKIYKSITNNNNEKLPIPIKLLSNLDGVLTQLNNRYEGRIISEKEFFLGEEPNYHVINKGFDIIKDQSLTSAKERVKNELQNKSRTIPFMYFKGSFGSGKTTFVYRVIHDLLAEGANDIIAFEILDIESFRKELALDLLRALSVPNIIFYINNIEIDSTYKAALTLRNELSFEQLPEKNICFVTSVRENILLKLQITKAATNTPESEIDAPFTADQVDNLLEKLRSHSIINFRDYNDKKILSDKILKEYKGDAFLSLLDIVADGKHIEYLLAAYHQLSIKCQEAFLYTALVHKFGLLMPASILKNILSTDWDDFTENVLKVEGKGILFHDTVESKGSDPDLFFRTKHKTIASKLADNLLRNDEKKYTYYKKIISNLNTGRTSTKFFINLIKALREVKSFDTKIDSLYDLAYKVLEDDPYFLLSYSTNLQYRRDTVSVEKGITLLKYAESLLPIKRSRDHRFIHRRGVLNFELAKLYCSDKEFSKSYFYIDEAEDLLKLKLQLDPNSSYSYTDFIELLLWKIDKYNLSVDEEIQIKVKIEDFFGLAFNSVTEGLNRITELQEKYLAKHLFEENETLYLQSLEELYHNNPKIRAYILILKYNFLNSTGKQNEAETCISEIESYSDDSDIANFLFKYYGKSLNIPNVRIKFYKVSEILKPYSEMNFLRYNYFNYISNYYEGYYDEAESYLFKIRNEYQYANPEYNLKWLNSEGNTNVFIGRIIQNEKHYKFRSKSFDRSFRLTKNSLQKLDKINKMSCQVELHFHLDGIYAEILDEVISN